MCLYHMQTDDDAVACVDPALQAIRLEGLVVTDGDESDSSSCCTAPQYSPLSSDYEFDEFGSEKGDGDDGLEESITEDEPGEEEGIAPSNQWYGYKMVGDNWDKGMKASFQRHDTHKNASVHYYHSYAVRDRVDLSTCSDVPPDIPANTTADSLLPTENDIERIKEDYAVLVSRYIIILST